MIVSYLQISRVFFKVFYNFVMICFDFLPGSKRHFLPSLSGLSLFPVR